MVHKLKSGVLVEQCMQRIFCIDVVETIMGFLRFDASKMYHVQKNGEEYELTELDATYAVYTTPMYGFNVFYSDKTNVVVSGGGVHIIRVHHAMVEYSEQITLLGMPFIVKDTSGINRIVEPQIVDGVFTGKYYVPRYEAVGWGYYNKKCIVKGCRLSSCSFVKFVGFVDCPELIHEMLHGSKNNDPSHIMEIYLCTKEGWSRKEFERWHKAQTTGSIDYLMNQLKQTYTPGMVMSDEFYVNTK